MIQPGNLLSLASSSLFIFVKKYIYIVNGLICFYLALWLNLDIFLCNRFEMLFSLTARSKDCKTWRGKPALTNLKMFGCLFNPLDSEVQQNCLILIFLFKSQ